MKTTTYQQQYANRMFHTILVIVLIILGIYASNAQVTKSGLKYKGFEVSFGNRSFNVNSNIKKIDGMHASHDGGTLGIVFGNDVLMTRLRVAGYFYSNNNTPHTQELFETAAKVNVYPLALFTKNKARLRPYLTGGLGWSNVKFYGFYMEQAKGERDAYEPYLGKVSQVSALGGLGFEYALSNQCDFVNLFAEVNTAVPLKVNSSNDTFNQTTITAYTSVNVGVSFGINNGR